MKLITSLAALAILGFVFAGSQAVAGAAAPPSTDGAARAGSNAGSSSLTPTQAPATTKHAKPMKGAASHRLPANASGMGSQAANTTGPTSGSH